ncbi:Kelch repeat-containing protein [Cavenderia fasciculata]|uniref:Kelch repeat-containing protein n=1 Tax=Cavenderia fasciculata TaxID=261658 RepID=F4Q128_CACFS|nr:Kelch repeat-containing protein [Cavenderia fasciculata]EGG18529.1 Kelch repeat-containing protein [Cavenderia fasciculata]|eukprot:XP_004366433.1 Kelch repeat-containing protein [Cavenderia fasciculata]
MMMNDNGLSNSREGLLIRNCQHLEYYKELSERTLELCDQSFIDTKKAIIQEFDTLIQYLNDRKIELLTQLAVELESHKQDLEKNRDKAQQLIESLEKRLRGSSGSRAHSPTNNGSSATPSSSVNGSGSLSPTITITSPQSSGGGSSSLSKASSAGSNLSASTPTILCKSTSSLDLMTDSGADAFLKMDQLAILKESIDIIEWKWVPEFQQLTTKTRVIATPKPLSPRQAGSSHGGYDVDDSCSNDGSLYDDSVSTSSSSNIKMSTASYQHGESRSSLCLGGNDQDSASSISLSASNSNSLHKSMSMENVSRRGGGVNGMGRWEREVNIYGKLGFEKRAHPEYRELSAMLPKQSYIYSIGGHLNGFDQYALERYDMKEGRWRTLKPLHQMDNDFTSHYDGRNSIYNFGGSLTPSKVTKYLIAEDRWEILSSEIPEGGRFLHSSVYDQKQFIYLLGGFPRSNSVLRFNLVTEEFTKLSSMKSLWKMSTVYDATTNSIYTIGGCNISGSSVNTFDRFDIDENRWVELSPLNHEMYSGGAIIDNNNGYIYVFGGFNSQNNETLNRVERYSIEHNKWEVVEPPIPQRMTFTNSTFFDGDHYVYLVGGHSPATKENISTVYRFNTITFEWDILTTFQHSRVKGSAIYISK